MKTLLKWFAGFFEDQAGSASSKRAVLYWSMGLLTYMVVKGVSNMEIFWGVISLVVAFGGYATSEYFKSKIQATSQQGGTQPTDPNDPRPR